MGSLLAFRDYRREPIWNLMSLFVKLQAFSFRLQVSDYTEIHGSMLSEFFQVALRLRVNVA